MCISSPLKRAVKTAEIVIDDKCDIFSEELLLERDFGEFEGNVIDDIGIDIFRLWDYKENYCDHGVESIKSLLERADKFVEKIKKDYNDCSNILIVSHGSFIKALYYSIKGYNENTDFLSFHLDNCGVYKCEL